MKILNVSNWYVFVLFIFYISFVLFDSFVGVSIFFTERLQGNYIGVSHNFIPFTTIGTYLFNIDNYNFDTWFYNTLGNVLLFLPIGVFLSFRFPKISKVWSIITILLFSLVIEIIQYITQLGVLDVDDILLNTFGGFLGFLILDLVNKKNLFN